MKTINDERPSGASSTDFPVSDPSFGSPVSRRGFLAGMGGVAAALATGVAPQAAPAVPARGPSPVEDCALGPANSMQRANQALQVRYQAALYQRHQPLNTHLCNGDEQLYLNKLGSYSKALPHNALGEVDLQAYDALIRALDSGRPADFEAIPLGGVTKLANPQAALAFELQGPDSHQPTMRPAPTFSSPESAAEMAEVYWMALTRDIPFSQYETDPSIAQAADDLSRFSDLRAPKQGGMVTPATLFRGDTPGDLTGPYVSQLLWLPIPYGAMRMEQLMRTTLPGDDHLTDYADWLSIQNGGAPSSASQFDPTARYIRNGRDLGEWVHRDFTFQAFVNAALILLGLGPKALDPGNPYRMSSTQGGFITFGGPHVLHLVSTVACLALKLAWYQKWMVHRRLRPEEYGGRVHNHVMGVVDAPIHSELLASSVLDSLFSTHGSYLLPMAYPEGCPTHTSYPAGHATIAGACATLLKAFFDESFVLPSPVVAADDGLALLPYDGPPLTVGGELNKLAANVAFARDFAGVHYRSDGADGMLLGEALALNVLTEMRETYNEDFAGFSVTKFDGTAAVV